MLSYVRLDLIASQVYSWRASGDLRAAEHCSMAHPLRYADPDMACLVGSVPHKSGEYRFTRLIVWDSFANLSPFRLVVPPSVSV